MTTSAYISTTSRMNSQSPVVEKSNESKRKRRNSNARESNETHKISGKAGKRLRTGAQAVGRMGMRKSKIEREKNKWRQKSVSRQMKLW